MKYAILAVLGSMFLAGCTGDKEDSAKQDSADTTAE